MIRTTIAAAAVCLTVAAPAVAAEVGATTTIAKAGQASPVTVPGTGLKQGAKLAKGTTLIGRTVTLSGKEQPRVRLTCASGSVLRGLVPAADSQDVGFVVAGKGSYAGRRAVTVRSYAKDRSGGEASGTILALCRKG